MFWVLALSIAGFVLLALVAHYQHRRPPHARQYARETATEMLRAYKSLHAQHPKLPQEKLYLAVLATRPTITPQIAWHILAKATQAARGRGLEARFLMLVLYTVTLEYRRRTQPAAQANVVALDAFRDEFIGGIRAVMPVSSVMLRFAVERSLARASRPARADAQKDRAPVLEGGVTHTLARKVATKNRTCVWGVKPR